MIKWLLIFGFMAIFFMGRRSTFVKPASVDIWKPVDELEPRYSRFRELDPKTYEAFKNELDEAKKELLNPSIEYLKGSNLNRSAKHLRDAVDYFSLLTGSLPSGDSPYHEEITEIAIEIAVVGEKAIIDAAEETNQVFTPFMTNALIE